ncbi:hypothetical protein F5Y11DRAFT_350890 [Daldinia sp. FL1419]|nr:hypothetical protein F5Y11DRAFT_350890 [Daldinia sp. FL1419]
MLYITSHDQDTILSPPPDLLFDLRSVPNPPKAMRETHTGQSHQVHDSLMQEPTFRELLERAKTEIHGAMQAAEEMQEDETAVRVGCLCGSGHHRSVAFSEQLAQMEWPDGWAVALTHRDLTPEVKRVKEREREMR